MRAVALASLIALVVAPLARAEDATPATPATPPTEVAAEVKPEVKPEETPAGGLISLTSTPSGKVFVDDKDTGLVTPVADFAVAAGKHTVKIVADDGRSTSSEFMIEAGGTLSLNLTLPELEAKPEVKPEEVKPADAPPADAAVAAPVAKVEDWSWMTVSGWSGLGLGTIGLVSGAVVLTTPTDPDQGPLGFGLFGAGVGLVLGGAVLLYLDNEIAAPTTATPEAPKAALN